MTSTVDRLNIIRRSGVFTILQITAVIWLGGVLRSSQALSASSSAFEGSIEIETQSSFSRLKISIDESFKPSLEETKSGFEIVIPSATLMDIGVPFGGDVEFNRYLSKIKDQRITDLSIQEKESKIVISGKYRFPTGAAALANPVMEHFDFRKNEQGKFMADFFYRKGPTIAQVNQAKRESEAKKLQAERELLVQKEQERKLLRGKRLAESKNALLFCDQPLDKNNTVFLRFLAEHPLLNFSSFFPEKVPDYRFDYREPKGNSEEDDLVRLALKLTQENKHALSIKTVDFLEKQYPKSKFLQEMKFLKANSFYRLGMEDKGKNLILEVSKAARGTEVGLQAAAFLAVQSYKNQEWLAALDSFMNLKREMPNHPLIWLFRYGMAECLYEIKQTDQARDEFEWVSKNAPKGEVRAEAAFKQGDLFFERGQYAQAIVSYSAAIKKNETMLAHYPEVLMNLAESYFQLEEWTLASQSYQRFLDAGKNRPNAWRASLRIAEAEGMNQKMSPAIEKSFTETINSYPMSPGAVVARLRLIPCGTHGGFDLGSATRFFSSPEVQNFTGDGMAYIGPFRELEGLTEVRTLISFQEDEKAIQRGIEHLRENPSVVVRHLIETAMIGGIKRILDHELSKGDEVAAISTYEKYGDFLPLPSHDPMADEIRMKLAKIASERKLTSLALKIIAPYKKINEQSEREVIAAVEKNLVLEGIDETEERNLIEARTLWNNPSFKAESQEEVDHLLSRLGFIRDESPFAFERDLIRALYYSEVKDFKKASALTQTITTRMTKVTPQARIQIWAWAAELAQKMDDLDFARKAYREARLGLSKVSEKSQGELTLRRLASMPSLQYLYESEGETLEKQQKWKESVALYSEAIENKIGGNHILYAHARALLKEGGRDSKKIASRSLEKIQQSQDDDVWKRLAEDQLKEIAKEGRVDEKRSQ